jgi:hypothetical protein
MKVTPWIVKTTLLAFGIACQNEAQPVERAGATGSTGESPVDPPRTAGASGTAAGVSSGGAVGDSSDRGGTVGRAGPCSGASASLEEVTSGSIPADSEIRLSGVTATSQKFLVFRSTAGSCLWGVFVSADVAVAAPGTGLLVVSYGDPAAAADGSLAPCRAGSDAIPDDVEPGDVLEARGKVSSFVSSSCPRATGAQAQLRASRACPLERSARRAPPTPAELSLSSADRVAAGSEPGFIRAWGNLLVRLKSVSGRPADAGTIVGRFGVIRLSETALEVHDHLYWNDLTGNGPGAAGKQPVFASNTRFLQIDGIIHLDFCSWSLNPRDKCSDFEPKSEDCP